MRQLVVLPLAGVREPLRLRAGAAAAAPATLLLHLAEDAALQPADVAAEGRPPVR